MLWVQRQCNMAAGGRERRVSDTSTIGVFSERLTITLLGRRTQAREPLDACARGHGAMYNTCDAFGKCTC